MKSGIYFGKEDVRIENREIPTVGDNDVLVKNLYSGICGTDVAVYLHGPNTGHKITVGSEFGHETVSEIVAVGKNIVDFKVGDRVYPYPRFAKNDTKRAGTIGAFSEYILISQAKKEHSLYVVPEEISDKVACLIEPFTVGCRAARRAQPKLNEQAVVFGCGTIGIATAIALKYFGLEKVMICDLSAFRLEIAQQLGFGVCNLTNEDFAEKSRAYFGTAKSLSGETSNIDIMVDAAGAESILNIFIEQGKIESRFVSVAVNNMPYPLDLLHLTYAQKTIIGSGGYMPEDVNDVMEIMKSGKWDLERIITHEFPIDELNKAIKTAADSKQAFSVTIHF